MTVERCRVTTDDRVVLDGALAGPAVAVEDSLPVDLFVLVHGTGSNFDAPGLLEMFASQAVAGGTAVLRINTRGHDGVPDERVSECRADLAAWCRFASERGHGRIVLVGHSMGGVKAVHAAAHEELSGLTAIVGISPPRFCHRRLFDHPDGGDFRADFVRAAEAVDAGRGGELLEIRQPRPMQITAECFVDKYGPADRYDLVQHLPAVRCPTLVMLGELSVASSPAFAGLPEDLATLAEVHGSLAVEVIEGAGINYRADPREPYRRAARWLNRRPGW